MKNTIIKRRLFSLVLAAIMPAVFSVFYFIIFKNNLAPIIYSFSKIFIILWPIICYRFIFKLKLPSINLKDKKHYKALIAGTIVGISTIAIILLLLQTEVKTVIFFCAGNIKQKAITFGVINNYILFSLGLSIIHSLIEEYYWRWFVFGNMVKLTGFYKASILSALAFSTHHFIVIMQYFPPLWAVMFTFGVFIGGLILNFLYYKQKTLFGAWIAHVLMDLAIMYVGYLIIFNH